MRRGHPQFGRVPYAVIDDGAVARMSGGEAKVMLVLCGHVNGQSCEARPTRPRIAKLTGMTERGVEKCIRGLEHAAVLEVHAGRGQGHASIYHIAMKGEPPFAFPDSQKANAGSTKGERPAPGKANPRSPQQKEEQRGTECAAAPPGAGPSEPPGQGKAKGKGNPKGDLPPIPAALDTSGFRAAWEDWQTHRREIGHRLTPTAAGRQLAKLAGWGVEQAIASIEQSIGHGWQGLFEPKGNGNPPAGRGLLDAPDVTEEQADAMFAAIARDQQIERAADEAQRAAGEAKA